MFRSLCARALVALSFAAFATADGQGPIALPNTVSSYAGGGTTFTVGSACYPGATLTASDTLGDGCPATLATLSSDIRGGVAASPTGDVYVLDTNNSAVRVVSSRSGLIQLLAGKGTPCASKTDSNGDNCPAGNTAFSSTPRGIAADVYGNVFVAGYGTQLVNVICEAVSPLCPNTGTGHKIGSMYLTAGCVANTGAAGTGGAGADGGTATPTGTCNATVAELNQPRGVAADIYGNVYIADTGNSRYRVVLGPQSYNGLTNPLFAQIQANPTYAAATLAAGNIYPILGGFTPPANGAACTSGSSARALDALGDGCPYYVAGFATASTSAVQGVAVDPSGDIIFTDLANLRLRVIYMGGAAMAKAITANNPGVTAPVVGSIYSIAGGGAGPATTSPLLGSSVSIDANAFKVTTDSNGNIYVGDGTFVLFYDVNTGYIRRIAVSGSACTGATDTIGDGCPATQASFGGSNGLGVAVNAQGDLFLADSNNSRVRRIAASSLLPTAVNGTSAQNIVVHAPTSSSGLTASLINGAAGGPIAIGVPACGAANADGTLDCTIPVTFSPKTPGPQSAGAVATSSGAVSSSSLLLSGIASGAAVAFDLTSSGPTATTLGSGLKAYALAIDAQGNLYTYNANASALVQVSPSGAGRTLPGALLAAPTQIAVDGFGNVYAVGDGSANVVKVALNGDGSYTAGTVPFLPNGIAGLPQAMTVDSAGDLYVYDGVSKAIYRVTQGPSGTMTAPILASPGIFTPTAVNALAMDAEGDLYISDAGAGKLYLLPGNSAFPWTSAPSAIASTSSLGLAVDASGSVYSLDSGSLSVLMYPLSGPSTVTAYAGLTSPTGIAVDGGGSVYVADASSTTLLKVSRNAATLPFGTSTSTTLAGFLSNVGNQPATGIAQTDSSDFQVVAGTSSGCTIAGTRFSAGSTCSISATFTPQAGSGNVADVLMWTPAASNSGSVTFTGTKSGTAVTTTTAIGGQAPASPVFSASGTEVTFTVSVTASAGTASGTVAVTVDASAPVSYTLDSTGRAAVSLAGLAAGSHTVSASYASQNGFTGSATSGPTTFSIGQASVTVSWTPTVLTQPFSKAIGTSVLNAVAVISGTSTPAPGSFVYTATPTGGAAQSIDAAAYLPVGSYSLGVTFVPADSTDYGSGTASVAPYTVTQASTSAAIGGTQNLVAVDGSGNYTGIQSALNSLPTSGGALYIKPGTYSGFVTVNLPGVALRGLGGDPTQVILTNEAGAFSPPYLAGQGPGNNGSTGDQGSATLVVARGTVNGVTATPNNFYMEGLTVQNTYDTDTTNSNSVGTVANVCQTITPTNNFALYNGANTSGSPGLCNSQALAVWITADQAVVNNVRLNSLQDTLYAGSQGCGATCTVARQYYWRGKITGDVDFIFGDAAAVFDHDNIYTVWHGASPTGTETIEAQNKKFQTGSAGDYLSGYVFNHATFTSQSTGMNSLYLGRPYGQFSTNILLNSYIDQVNPIGYIEFSGQTNLPTSTYAEFNTTPYNDPAVGQPDLNGVAYSGTGGNTGAGANGTRETTSIQPTVYTAAQAAPWFPVNFLGSTVSPASLSTGQSSTWDPTAALAAGANGFVPASSPGSIASGSVFTLLMRPQTPGAGSIPTGSWTLFDKATQVATGTLDASGQAYYTTNTLSVGQHSFTWTYGGDSNFSGATTATPYAVQVSQSKVNPLLRVQPQANATYGTAASVGVSASASSGTYVPTGQVSLTVDSGAPVAGTLAGTGSYTFSLTGLPAGPHSLTVTYAGDANFNSGTINGSLTVSKAVLQVTANSFTIPAGSAVPAYTASYSGFVAGDTSGSATTGSPALTTNPAAPAAPGTYTITAATGTLTSSNYTFSFINGTLTIRPPVGATAVATGDTRTVSEPSFPSTCSQLTASLTSVNDDIPTSVDGSTTNPDGSRIQAALAGCANTNQAVRLSVDSAGHNAFLTGPLSMPSGVTLLVDPGVTVFFSRNVQDYDAVAGTHTCGTVNANSATGSCLPLISIKNATNVGIMGYGKLDGRGGDTLLNAFPAAYNGQSWWGLSAIANSGGNQQNPRFIQIGNSSNVTLYKITLRNSPLFHVSTTSSTTGLTAWDVKIVTPTSARNTDGIDPGNVTNATIAYNWVSDGDDNVAVGASGSSGSANISVINNHFFAGHGESIGSFTGGGVNNVLFDSNMLAGNSSVDSNSTGLRIKSANDRGGVVQNIQYSNSCFQNHKTEIQFTPLYNTNSGTSTPNFKNILLQNLSFLTEGTVQFTGASNNGTVNPLTVTLDNVSFKTLAASDFNAAPTNAQLTYGPGQVSSNFIAGYSAFVGANGNTATDNRTAASLAPPNCTFTFIAPELTGPNGVPQTIISGQTATAVVILTPAVGGSAYPTGTVVLTDQTTGLTYTATLTGSGDTLLVPLTGLSVGTHTLIAAYAGDSNYVPAFAGAAYSTTNTYSITVNAGSLGSTTTTLAGAGNSTYGTPITVTATVTGASPTGTVQFALNGAVTSSSTVGSNGTATATLNLPVGTYSLQAIYSGDAVNAGSPSAASNITIAAAATSTTLTASSTTTNLGVPLRFTATVSSLAGTPAGSVAFSYTTTANTSPTTFLTSTLTNGTAVAAANLPVGADSVVATYAASGSFGASKSTALTVTVNPPVAVPLSTDPIALPYTISTFAGGANAANANTSCAGSTDAFGNGCQASAINLTSAGLDLRSVVADPFGNVYFTDANANQVRRISPNGVINLFAGYVSGTACTPTPTTSCTPTLVKLNKPRGISADAAGNIYIAGYSDNKVYKVSVATGLLSLVAGTGTKPSDPTQSNGDGSTATSALLNGPRAVWADSIGDIYIADTTDNKVRVVDVTGNIQIVAGTGAAASSGDGGPANQAAINNPQGVLTDPSGNVYLAEGGRVRVVCVTCTAGSGLYQLLNHLGIAAPQNGFIYTLAGGATAPYTAPALANTISLSPQKLAMDVGGNLYVSDGGGAIYFVDARTAYIRKIAGGATAATTCNPTATPNIGDGCPATQAIIGNGGNGIGVGTDTHGNIYIADTLNARIRKVSTNLAFASTATGTPLTSTAQFHLIAGDTLPASGPIAIASTEYSAGTPNCTTNVDTTADCTVPLTFTPAVPGFRPAAFAIATANGHIARLGLTGKGLGAGATFDPGNQITFGQNLQIAGIAVDAAGNTYVSDTSSRQVLKYTPAAMAQGTAASPAVLATLTTPGALAVDTRGYVYVADSATGQITQISPSGSSSLLGYKFGAPAGMTTDVLDNLYVSDSSTGTVYQLNPITGSQKTLGVSGLSAPGGLAIDPDGNLIVTDPVAVATLHYNLSTGATTTIPSPATQPFGVAVDAAGNLLIADISSIIARPASTNSAAFPITATAPSALALDPAGDIYTNSGSGSVLVLQRTNGSIVFSAPSVPAQTFNVLSTGNQPLSITSFNQTGAADFTVGLAASTDCVLGANPALALPVGGACSGTASFNPVAYGRLSDTITATGNAVNAALSTPASEQLILTGTNPASPTSTSLGSIQPAAPIYGQTVSITATVSSSSGTPGGSVTFTVDGSTFSVGLANGSATLTLTNPAAGSHTVSAAYPGAGAFAGSSTAGNVTITVAKATPSAGVSANPAGGTPLSTIVLAATVSSAAGKPTGSVQFYSGTAALGSPVALVNGTASFTTNLPAGSNPITATYSGDGSFQPVTSAAVTVSITKLAPAISVGSDPTSADAGSSIILSASVNSLSGTPTGIVQFYVGTRVVGPGVTLAGGIATLSTTALPAGNNSITAQYGGDANFAAVTSGAVAVAIRSATALSLTANPPIPTAGLAQGITETFSATLTGGVSPTGTVTFYDGATALSTALALSGSNTASFTPASSFTVGSHTISARFTGDPLNQPATSSGLTFNSLSSVLPGFSFSTGLTPGLLTIAAGGSSTTTLTVTPNALYGGTVTFSCPGAPANITCAFAPGSLAFTPSSSTAQTATLTVTAANTTTARNGPSVRGAATRILAALGAPLLFLAFSRRRRSLRSSLLAVFVAAAATLGVLAASGCAGHGSTQAYAINVVATDGTNTQTVPLSIVVTH